MAHPPKGTCIYTYDFGSSTILRISRRNGSPELPAGARVAVLARNHAPKWPCDACDGLATSYCTQCDETYCDDCTDTHEADGCEDFMLPLLNSPRAGTCGYNGPTGECMVWPPGKAHSRPSK